MKTYMFLFIIFLVGCANAQNYKQAYVIKKGDKVFIELKGKRKYLAHNPSDIGKTYEDSILIEIQEYKDGVIDGRTIPVKPGYYKYEGNILINKNRLQVNLLINNTDDKKLNPSDWNGEYIVKLKE
jgi:hypothetical protein